MYNIVRNRQVVDDLEMIYTENKEMYANLIRNITAAKKMFLMHQAESNFMSGDFKDFKCYKVAGEKRGEVNKYFNTPTIGDSEYVLVHRRYDYAVIIMLNSDGYVCNRSFLYDLYDIEDLFIKFHDYVFEFYPKTKNSEC